MSDRSDHPSNGGIHSSLSRYLAAAAARQLRAESEAEDRVMGETIRKYERVLGHHLFMRVSMLDEPNRHGQLPPEVITDADGREWEFAAQLTPATVLYARRVRWWSLADRRKWRRETRIALQL